MMNDIYRPSFLASWLFWRNEKTTPGSALFNLVREELNLPENKTLNIADFTSGDSFCPYCQDRFGRVNVKEEIYYCVCQIVDWQNQIELEKNILKLTKINPTTFDQINYPKQMPPQQQASVKLAVENAKRFIRNPNKWFLISGALGVGKTHILKAIYMQFEPIAIYISSGYLETAIHQARKDDALGDLHIILAEIPILFIDDLGAEYGGPLVTSTLQKIIDYRYENFPSLPVVMTSNLSPIAIVTAFGRTGDRITDRARVVVNQIGGVSYRQLKVEERNG